MAEVRMFSNEAEMAVLSIILRFPDSVYELDGLKSFMFQSTPHVVLFREIEELIEKQAALDPSLLMATLESSGEINEVGTRKYVENLLNQNQNKDSLEQWKNLVIDCYKTRTLSSIGANLKLENINTDNINDTINGVKRQLDSLMEVRGGVQTVHIGETVYEVFREISARHENPGLRGYTWGISELDKMTGGKCPGELWVIGGRPGAGKTALICNSILTDALSGNACLIFEREMRTQEIVERLISLSTGIPITNIRLGVLDQKQVDSIYGACAQLKDLPIYIDTSYRSTDLYYIESTIQKYKRLFDIKVVYLDYIQILVDREEQQTNEIGRVSRLFKSLANELNICSVLVSQLNRGVESRDNKRPVLSDLRQSGNLEEDADVVVGLYREDYYNPQTTAKGLMEFIILKYRNGKPGTVTLKFNDTTNKIIGS